MSLTTGIQAAALDKMRRQRLRNPLLALILSPATLVVLGKFKVLFIVLNFPATSHPTPQRGRL
jgi:hypothetical protein